MCKWAHHRGNPVIAEKIPCHSRKDARPAVAPIFKIAATGALHAGMDILAARRDAAPSFADPVCPPATLPVLVAYDISDHRRRRRLYRLLSGFGEPLQESVFLCWVDAPPPAPA